VHGLPNEEFVAEMRAIAGTPDIVLDDAELRSLLLPILRADFRICETYVHRPGPVLRCPIVAIAGVDDPFATADAMVGWDKHTAAAFTLRVLRADHFSLVDLSRDVVLLELAAARGSTLDGPAVRIGEP
jgi:medium-chain acyl-[acyl-carrier-protein] hydrolase